MRARLRLWVAGHPVAALLIWFFAVGQALAFAPAIAASAGHRLPTEPFTMASTWMGLLLPALYVTWVADGRKGLRRLAGDLRPVRPRWFVAVLLVLPVTCYGIAGLVAGPPSATAGLVLAAYAEAGAAALIHLLSNNLWEEVAWMGVVQLRLQERSTPTRAILLTAPLFAFQHLALVADNSAIAALAVTTALVLLAFPYRAAMGWLYNRTHSLLLVGVAHAVGDAMATGSGLAEAFLPGLYGRNLGPLHLFAFALLGTAVWITTRGRLGQQNRPGRSDEPTISDLSSQSGGPPAPGTARAATAQTELRSGPAHDLGGPRLRGRSSVEHLTNRSRSRSSSVGSTSAAK